METLLFYDLETTGLSKSFDQVLQFAGIRTDKNLVEIERYELNVINYQMSLLAKREKERG